MLATTLSGPIQNVQSPAQQMAAGMGNQMNQMPGNQMSINAMNVNSPQMNPMHNLNVQSPQMNPMPTMNVQSPQMNAMNVQSPMSGMVSLSMNPPTAQNQMNVVSQHTWKYEHKFGRKVYVFSFQSLICTALIF